MSWILHGRDVCPPLGTTRGGDIGTVGNEAHLYGVTGDRDVTRPRERRRGRTSARSPLHLFPRSGSVSSLMVQAVGTMPLVGAVLHSASASTGRRGALRGRHGSRTGVCGPLREPYPRPGSGVTAPGPAQRATGTARTSPASGRRSGPLRPTSPEIRSGWMGRVTAGRTSRFLDSAPTRSHARRLRCVANALGSSGFENR